MADSANKTQQRFELNTKMRHMTVQLGRNQTAVIFYEKPEWKRFAHQIDYVLRTAVAKVDQYLEMRPGLYLEIILLNSATFKSFITASPWVKAAYHKGRIFIPIGDKQAPNLDELAATITHEFCHVVIADLTNSNAPGWLDEGLAMLIEGKDSYAAEMRYKDWLRYNKPLRLDQLSAGFTHLDRDEANNAYVQSKIAVKYLLDQYGKQRLNQFLERLATMPDTAFSDIYDFPLSELSKE